MCQDKTEQNKEKPLYKTKTLHNEIKRRITGFKRNLSSLRVSKSLHTLNRITGVHLLKNIPRPSPQDESTSSQEYTLQLPQDESTSSQESTLQLPQDENTSSQEYTLQLPPG